MTTHLNGFAIIGAIEAKWLEKGGQGGLLGLPLGNEEPTIEAVREGRIQRFTGGVVVWHADIGAHEVHGLILVRWQQLGEVVFGYPISDETGTPDGEGRCNHFRAMHMPGNPESSIYWHPATGAHEVYGWIRGKWASLGWERSIVGYPTGPETAGTDTGRLQRFQGGIIAWHPGIADGAHEVHGLVCARWDAIGATTFGYPTTDETGTPDGKGRYNHFRAMHVPGNPDSSIYWHPDTGAHEVYGWIRGRWASLGWERSILGYPVSNERNRRGAGRVQDFKFGAIAWLPGGEAWVDWSVNR